MQGLILGSGKNMPSHLLVMIIFVIWYLWLRLQNGVIFSDRVKLGCRFQLRTPIGDIVVVVVVVVEIHRLGMNLSFSGAVGRWLVDVTLCDNRWHYSWYTCLEMVHTRRCCSWCWTRCGDFSHQLGCSLNWWLCCRNPSSCCRYTWLFGGCNWSPWRLNVLLCSE